LLLAGVRGAGLRAEEEPGGVVLVRAEPEAVGVAARDAGVALSELTAVSRKLEDAFLELTDERPGAGPDEAAGEAPAEMPGGNDEAEDAAGEEPT
ncbi:MAG: hypothetical protein ACRDKH_09195, partial [Solirubrobacterales bacterium]